MLLGGRLGKKARAANASVHAVKEQTFRITFFGGKGGVGKTTCSSAYALSLASGGYRTLLVSTDPAHSLSDLFEVAIDHDLLQVKDNLWVREIDPETASKRYMAEVKRNLHGLAAPALWREVERQMDFAAASPGADEAALFDEMVSTILEAQGVYDRLVFDTAPTGHTLRLLSLPELMGVWIEGMIARRKKTQDLHRMMESIAGTEVEPQDHVYEMLQKRKNRFAAVRELLLDETVTSFCFVLNPERLSIIESAKALAVLRKYEVPIRGLIVNRVLPEEADGAFFAQRREQEQVYLREIEDRFPRLQKLYIPMKPSDIRGLEGLGEIASQFRGTVM